MRNKLFAEKNRKKLAMVYVLMASGVSKRQVEKSIKQLFAPKSDFEAVTANPFWRSRVSKSFYDPLVGVHLKTWSYCSVS